MISIAKQRIFCFSIILVYCVGLDPHGLFAQKSDGRFDIVAEYARHIIDTPRFLQKLQSSRQLKNDGIGDSAVRITAFFKTKIYGLNGSAYMLELAHPHRSMAEYPWKSQLVFDEKSRLLLHSHSLQMRPIKLFPNSNPLLLVVCSTAQGNGWHELYGIRKGKAENMLEYPEGFCLRTYDECEDQTVNSPVELSLTIKDVNHDGWNDMLFSGDVVVIMGITKDNEWYDADNSGNGKLTKYSKDNPFKKIHIEVPFLYNPTSGHFLPKSKYQNYCTDSLFKLIYPDN